MTMKQTAKSLSSRRNLVSAAGRVLRERGLHGVRVREVATAAGMSVGAIMYHYPTIEDLLLAVHTETQEQYLRLRRSAGETPGDIWKRLIETFKVGLPPFADSDLIELLYEMHGLTRRNPRHALLLTELWETELRLCIRIVEDGVQKGEFQVEDSENAARALLALEDGLALHLVSDNAKVDGGSALRTYSAAAAAILNHDSLRGYVGENHPVASDD